MAVRQGPVDLGNDDAASLRVGLGKELRETRLALGISQRSAARSARISPSKLGRIERGATRDPSLVALCRVARCLGLRVSVKLYPEGSRVRDAGQLAIATRYAALLGAPLQLRGETVLPGADDNRAWDGVTVGTDSSAFNEYESHLGDIQALARRLELKLRDDPRSGVVILVVARTRHNRRVLEEHRESLRQLLPMDGPAIARELRAGRVPRASGIILI